MGTLVKSPNRTFVVCLFVCSQLQEMCLLKLQHFLEVALVWGAIAECNQKLDVCYIWPQMQHDVSGCCWLIWLEDTTKAERDGVPSHRKEGDGEICCDVDAGSCFALVINDCSIRCAASIALSSCITWSTGRTRCWAICGRSFEINCEVTYVGHGLLMLSPSLSSL